MQVSEKSARSILEGMGCEGVSELNVKKLSNRLNNLEELLSNGCHIPEDKAVLSLFRSVSKVLQEGEEITVNGAAEQPVHETSDKVEGKVVKVKEKAKKSVEKKVEDKKTDKTRPGVIATIISLLKIADHEHPATKQQILEHLVKSFPDRKPESMKSTLNQASFDLKKKGIVVLKNEKGLWIE